MAETLMQKKLYEVQNSNLKTVNLLYGKYYIKREHKFKNLQTVDLSGLVINNVVFTMRVI